MSSKKYYYILHIPTGEILSYFTPFLKVWDARKIVDSEHYSPFTLQRETVASLTRTRKMCDKLFFKTRVDARDFLRDYVLDIYKHEYISCIRSYESTSSKIIYPTDSEFEILEMLP